MIKSLSPSKPDKPGPIVLYIQKCLTLSDIENNLKKYAASEPFENLEEFMMKAKANTEGAYVTVKINLDDPLSPSEFLNEDLELNEEPGLIKTENTLFSCALPRRKTSNGSNLRFGLAPLESIEENMNEEVLVSGEFKNKFIHFSQHPSHQFDMSKAKAKVIERTKGRSLKRKKFRSPYSEGISPTRLPAIKKGEQTVKILKSFSLIKNRK